jgi:hypothetical protein
MDGGLLTVGSKGDGEQRAPMRLLMKGWAFIVLMTGLGEIGSAWGQAAALSELQFKYEAWQASVRAHRRAQQLFEQGIGSIERVDEARVAELRAWADFQASLEAFVRQHLSPAIQEVAKFRQDDGTAGLAVTVLVPPLPQWVPGSDVQFSLAIPLLRVQVLADGVIATYPYEALFYDVRPGDRRTARFRLLRPDIQRAEIVARWDNTDRRYPVLLTEAQPLTIRTSTPAQEALLGSNTRFALSVERGNAPPETYRLDVEGLPATVEAVFVIPETQAQVRQLTFSESQSAYQLYLEVRLPEVAGPDWAIDREIPFSVRLTAVGDGREAARLPLRLIPRGQARLEVAPEALFLDVRAGVARRLGIWVRNKGVRPATNVSLRIEGPRGWVWRQEPSRIDELPPHQESRVELTVTPPEDAGVGDFILNLAAEGTSGGTTVRSPSADVRVQVRASASWVVYGLTALLLIASALFIRYMVRLARQ